MITLTTANDLVLQKQQFEVWAVMISYRDDPDCSTLQLFLNYNTAKEYFNDLIPDEDDVTMSEEVRASVERHNNDSDIVRLDRQYYLDHDYYEQWYDEEWTGNGVMSYYISLDKVKISRG